MTFSSDWTETRVPEWEGHLDHLKGKPVEILEIGVFEGQTSKWFLENIVSTHKDSYLTGVDPYLEVEPYPNSPANARDSAELVYRNMRSTLMVMSSQDFWSEKAIFTDYDLIYVDGCHETPVCLLDLCCAFIHLKVGGILIMDDWQNAYAEEKPLTNPRIAMNKFLDSGFPVDVVWSAHHTIGLRKLRNLV